LIGSPHDKWGGQVHATVAAEPIDAASIIPHVKSRVGGVKAPRSVQFIEAIPRTAAGKMDNKTLRVQHWGKNVRMVN
jgi:fatty-acyl-CoA synthase